MGWSVIIFAGDYSSQGDFLGGSHPDQLRALDWLLLFILLPRMSVVREDGDGAEQKAKLGVATQAM